MSNARLALARARRGDKFLAEKLGAQYWTEIELEDLNMSDPCYCVIGQIVNLVLSPTMQKNTFGNRYFIVVESEWGLSTPKQQSLGFFYDLDRDVDYPDLDKAWLQVLKERREGKIK